MNAKELREAAQRLIDIIRDVDLRGLAQHILATVRDDDDESCDERWKADTMTGQTLNTIIFVSMIEDSPQVGGCKTRGQFRSLCRGLGITLKEGGK